MNDLSIDTLESVVGGACYESGTFGFLGFEFQLRIGDCSMGKEK
jgi:hypothetical protein